VSDQWQPIETAPMDGTELLCYWADVSIYHMCVARFVRSENEWYSETMAVRAPDYWMPLPPPPEQP
jgi:hypothetical protein